MIRDNIIISGTILSTSAGGSSQVQVFGPPRIKHLLASARYSYRRGDIAVEMKTVDASLEDHTILSDENVKVYAFSSFSEDEEFERPRKKRRSESNGETSASNTNKDTIFESLRNLAAKSTFLPAKLSQTLADTWRTMIVQDMYRSTNNLRQFFRPSPAWDIRPLPGLSNSETPADESVSYLVAGPAVRGKFLPQLAKAQGIRPGPLFGKLSRGEPVTNEKGDIIKPESCMEEGQPPAACLIIDCPTTRHLSQLISQPYKPYLKSSSAVLKAIYYRLGPGVIGHSSFQTWMESFGSECEVGLFVACWRN